MVRLKRLQEVEERFSIYMEAIQKKLAESNHAIVGCGIHPNWDKNENCPVAYPRYQMLMDYLSMGSHQEVRIYMTFHNTEPSSAGVKSSWMFQNPTICPSSMLSHR